VLAQIGIQKPPPIVSLGKAPVHADGPPVVLEGALRLAQLFADDPTIEIRPRVFARFERAIQILQGRLGAAQILVHHRPIDQGRGVDRGQLRSLVVVPQGALVLSQAVAGRSQSQELVGSLLRLESGLHLAPRSRADGVDAFELGDDLAPLATHVRWDIRALGQYQVAAQDARTGVGAGRQFPGQAGGALQAFEAGPKAGLLFADEILTKLELAAQGSALLFEQGHLLVQDLRLAAVHSLQPRPLPVKGVAATPQV